MALQATPQLLALLGALTGGSASYLTIRMFFGPHRERHLLGMRLPFTPGLFPSIQPRLADRIAILVHETLLTPADFHYLATKLVTPEKIEHAIELVITSVIAEFRNTTNLHRLARDLGALASETLGQALHVVIQRALSGESQVFNIADLVDRAVDYLLEELVIPPKLADFLAEKVMEGILSPASLRARLVDFLTPEAIEALARAIKRYTSGGLGMLLYFVNLKDALTKFRLFMEEDPDQAEQMLADVMERAKLRQAVARELQAFNLRQLPWSTVDFLKQTTTAYIRDYLATHKETLVPQLIERLEVDQLIADAIIRLDPDRIPAPLLKRLRKEIADFIQRYLDRDLARLIEQVLSGLDVPTVIADKVRSFPSPVLERMIEDTGRPRLIGMILAGAGLGGALGALAGTFLIG